MNLSMIRVGLVTGALLSLLVGSLWADDTVEDGGGLEKSIIQVRSISDERGSTRVLLRPDDLSEILGEFVISATLEIPLAGSPPERGMTVYAYLVGREWTDAATWTSPWSRPGGDLVEESLVTAQLGKQDAPISLQLDVSEAVRAMVDGDEAQNGFLLTVGSSERDGFDSDELQTFGTFEGAKLYVDFRRISLLGFPKEGSKALWKKSVAASDRD